MRGVSENFKWSVWGVHGAGLLLAIVLGLGVIIAYVSTEQNFHWWIDWYTPTVLMAQRLRQEPLGALVEIWQSFGNERSLLFTLLPALLLQISGVSRLSYTIALFLVYLLPFCWVMGAIVTQLLPGRPDQSVRQAGLFQITVLLMLVSPIVWISTLLGIPDTGAALMVGFALLLYLQDPALKQLWRLPLIGLTLALAILLRRHFAYSGLAFLGALALQGSSEILALIVRRRPFSDPDWRRSILWLARFSLIPTSSLLMLCTLAWGFIQLNLNNNYRHLYQDWTLPFAWIGQRYVAFWGLLPLAIAIFGWVWGIYRRLFARQAAQTLLLMGGLAAIQWLVVLRYANTFYCLHLMPLILPGMAAGIWFLITQPRIKVFWPEPTLVSTVEQSTTVGAGSTQMVTKETSRPRPSRFLLARGRQLQHTYRNTYIHVSVYVSQPKVRQVIVLALLLLLFAVNGLLSLTAWGTIPFPLRRLWAISFAPIVRPDYGEIMRLVDYLRQLPGKEPPIFIVGNQRLGLNRSLIRAAEIQRYGPQGRQLNILGSPQVDSQDYYPLETLLQAQYVVWPERLPYYQTTFQDFPAQAEWLSPQASEVVKVVWQMFQQQKLIAQDFHRLPEQFSIVDDRGPIALSIYQRLNPTSTSMAVKTLHQMQQAITPKPGSQGNWLAINQPTQGYLISQAVDQTARLTTFPRVGRREPIARFLTTQPLPAAPVITGQMNFYQGNCETIVVSWERLNAEGHRLDYTITQHPVEGATRFQVKLRPVTADYLLIGIVGVTGNRRHFCSLDINHLQIN